jgi:hypothetical protein
MEITFRLELRKDTFDRQWWECSLVRRHGWGKRAEFVYFLWSHELTTPPSPGSWKDAMREAFVLSVRAAEGKLSPDSGTGRSAPSGPVPPAPSS